MREISKLIAGIILLILVNQTGFALEYSSPGSIQNPVIQQKDITGTVSDSKTGETLVGVSIVN